MNTPVLYQLERAVRVHANTYIKRTNRVIKHIRAEVRSVLAFCNYFRDLIPTVSNARVYE